MAQQGATVTYSEGGLLDRFPWYVQLLVLLAGAVFNSEDYNESVWGDTSSKEEL